MTSAWRLWAGRISDQQLASRIVIAAGVALPAMYAMTLAGLWAASFKIGRDLAGQPYTVVHALTLGSFILLGAALAWRASRIASVLVAVLAATLAAAANYFFAIWIVVPTIRAAALFGPARIASSFWILAALILFLAGGWSATAFLGWRAVMATFAVARLRLSARSVVGEVFD